MDKFGPGSTMLYPRISSRSLFLLIAWSSYVFINNSRRTPPFCFFSKQALCALFPQLSLSAITDWVKRLRHLGELISRSRRPPAVYNFSTFGAVLQVGLCKHVLGKSETDGNRFKFKRSDIKWKQMLFLSSRCSKHF